MNTVMMCQICEYFIPIEEELIDKEPKSEDNKEDSI
jgi:hypothetical protein